MAGWHGLRTALTADPENPWIEHAIDAPLNFAHSLRAWQDAKTKQVHVLAGEMNEGGWAAPYNWDARLIKYTTLDGGKSWRSEVIYQGEGTHEAVYTDLDGSGTHVIFGHSATGHWPKDGIVHRMGSDVPAAGEAFGTRSIPTRLCRPR